MIGNMKTFVIFKKGGDDLSIIHCNSIEDFNVKTKKNYYVWEWNDFCKQFNQQVFFDKNILENYHNYCFDEDYNFDNKKIFLYKDEYIEKLSGRKFNKYVVQINDVEQEMSYDIDDVFLCLQILLKNLKINHS